jgi:O-antigen/teichoic acid export membrane protein
MLGLGLSIVSVKFINHNPILWLAGQGLSLILFGLLALWIIKKKHHHENKNYSFNRKELFSFAVPILITNIFVWIMSQSFRFFLKGSVNDNLLGEMAFGLGLASALAVAIEYLFQQLLFPSFYSALLNAKEDREKSWNKLFAKSAPAYVCLVMYMGLLSPFILNVLADDKFRGAITFFALGAVLELFRMLGNMVNMAYQSEMKTKSAISSYAIGGVITLSGILFISWHTEYLFLTPAILILGQFSIFLSLFFNLKKLMNVESVLKKVLLSILKGLPFLLVVFLYDYRNLYISIFTCGVCGLYLLFLFHQIQKDEVK